MVVLTVCAISYKEYTHWSFLENGIRIQYRYVFACTPLIIICFLSACETCEISSRWYLILATLIGLGSFGLNIIPQETSRSVDCVSWSAILWGIYKIESYTIRHLLFGLIISVILAIGYWCIRSIKYNLLKKITIYALLFEYAISSCFIYLIIYNVKLDSKRYVDDMLIINEYIEADSNNILFVADGGTSMGVQEWWCTKSYFLCYQNDYTKYEQNNAESIVVTDVSKKYKLFDVSRIDYIVSQSSLDTNRWEEVDLGLNSSHLYLRK